MERHSRWAGMAKRFRSLVETGLGSMAPLSGVPWPDLPAQGWTVGCDGSPEPTAAPMDGGPDWSYRPGLPLTRAEQRAWVQLRKQLTPNS
jgi:hypothetical protein